MADAPVDGDAGGAGGDGAGDTRSMLSDFYGAMLAAPAEEDGGAGGEGEDGAWGEGDGREDGGLQRGGGDEWDDASSGPSSSSPSSSASAASARASARRVQVDERLDLDSERFQPSMYVDELLRVRPMKELLEDDARLVAQKRSLDSDMQMLVYENYNKFITATDMIRKMKENVEGMEAEMQSLTSSMHSIRASTSAIEQQLTPNRERVENLVGVSRLLKRLEFLFELPGRLQQAIELQAYEQAVKYFRLSSNILAQYSHLKSFADIRRDSEQIISRLKVDLFHSLKLPNTSADQALANAAMLIDLLEPAQPILHSILQPRTDRLKAELRKCVEMQAVALKKQAIALSNKHTQQQQQATAQLPASTASTQSQGSAEERVKKASEGGPGKAGGAAGSERNPFGAEDGNGEGVGGEEEGGSVDADASTASARRLSSASTASAPRKGSMAGSVGGGGGAGGDRRGSVSSVGQLVDADGDEEVLDAGADLLSLLQQHFLTPFYVFTSQFNDLILKPLSSQQAAAKKPNKAKQDSLDRCHASLLSFTTQLFDEFLPLVKKELYRRGNLVHSNASTSSSASSSLQSQLSAVSRFTSQVSAFQQSMERVSPLVPAANLQRRVKEVIDLAIRHAVESIVELTQAQLLDVLVRLHADVQRFDALQHAWHTLDAMQLPSAELQRALASSHDSAAPPSGLPSPSALATAMRARLEECIQTLAALLDTQQYMKEDTVTRTQPCTAQPAPPPPPRLAPLALTACCAMLAATAYACVPLCPLSAALADVAHSQVAGVCSAAPHTTTARLCDSSLSLLLTVQLCAACVVVCVVLCRAVVLCVSAAGVVECASADARGASQRGSGVHRSAAAASSAGPPRTATAATTALLPIPLAAVHAPRRAASASVTPHTQPHTHTPTTITPTQRAHLTASAHAHRPLASLHAAR